MCFITEDSISLPALICFNKLGLGELSAKAIYYYPKQFTAVVENSIQLYSSHSDFLNDQC